MVRIGISSATAWACSATVVSSMTVWPSVSRVSRTYTPVTTGSACAPMEPITSASLLDPQAPVGSLALKLSTHGKVSCSANASEMSLSRDASVALVRVMRHK